MIFKYTISKIYTNSLLTLFLLIFTVNLQAQTTQKSQVVNDLNISVSSAKKINLTTFELLLSNHQRLTLDFYGDNIFRIFQDNNGGIIRYPEAKPSAQILVNNP